MPDRPNRQPALRQHVRAAARPHAESERLLSGLMSLCWPGGHADRVEPHGRRWLSLWGPHRTVVELPLCDCPFGRRCASCN